MNADSQALDIDSEIHRAHAATMKKCFGRLGIPNTIVSDNGPQFTARQFQTFSQEWNFTHCTSSPYYPQANGKAESAVKIAKRILRRCDDPELALLEYRNTPVESATTSPIQQLIGRSTRSVIPQKMSNCTPTAREHRDNKLQHHRRVQKHYNKSAKPLPRLRQGQPVRVRDWLNHRRLWKEGRIEKQLSDRSYSVQIDDNLTRRNRRDIRAIESNTDNQSRPDYQQNDVEYGPAASNTSAADEQPPTRRSTRSRKPPVWHNDYIHSDTVIDGPP